MAAASTTHGLPETAEPPTWIWDHDRRRIVWANEAALRFWGERTMLDLLDRDFPPNDPAVLQFAQLLDASLRSNVERVRARIVLIPSTRPVRIEASAAQFALADGRPGLRIEAQLAPAGEDAELERLREIVENAPQPLSLFAEDGSLLHQNAAADYVFGAERLASLAQRYGDSRKARDALRALLVNGAFNHGAALETRFGRREHRISMRRILDPVSGNYAALTQFVDTTERVEALVAAAGRERAAESTVLTNIEAGAAVFDDALKPLFMNELAQRMLGVAVDNAREPLVRLFPRERQRIAEALTRVRDHHADSARIELAVEGQDGRLRWVRMDFRRGGWRGAGAWVATVTDVTAERRAAITAQRLVDDRDVALGRMGIGVAALRRDFTLAAVSDTAAQLLGISPASAAKSDLRDLLSEESRARFEKIFEENSTDDAFHLQLASERTPRDLQFSVAPGDQWNRDYRIVILRAATPVVAKSGDSVLERREALSRTSHELRTPLTAILGFTQLMLRNPGPITSDAYVGYLSDIEESSLYMLRLLQDLLDLRRLEQGGFDLDPKPLDLKNLLRTIVRQSEVTAMKRDIDVTLSAEESVPAIMVDAHTIRQAITNLVGNAVKFASSPGWVRISLLRRASGAVELEVIDNGPGMNEEELAAAMQPFQQGASRHGTYGGAGMGLPLAKGFVEANGARFELKSEKDLGTIARIIFPPDMICLL